MHNTMEKAKGDPRVSQALRTQMARAWESGYGYVK
jgi:hypothetical protein